MSSPFTLSANGIVELFYGLETPGTPGLTAIQDATRELEPLFQKVADSVDTMVHSLFDEWQGSAAELAGGALQPLSDSAATTVESLKLLAEAIANEIGNFVRSRVGIRHFSPASVTQMPNPIIAASGSTAVPSLLAEIQREMEVALNNVQVYDQYVTASSHNTAGVPRALNISPIHNVGIDIVAPHAGKGVTDVSGGFMFTPAVVETQLSQADGILRDLQTASARMEPIQQGARATNDPAGAAISAAISNAGGQFVAGVDSQRAMVTDWSSKLAQAKQGYMAAEGLTEAQWNRLVQGLPADTTPAPRRTQVVTTRPAAHAAVPPRPVTRPPAPPQPPLPGRPQAGDGFVPPPPVTTPSSVTIVSSAAPLTPTPIDNGPILTGFVPPEDLPPAVAGVLFGAPVPLGGGVPGPVVGGASQTLQPTSGTGQPVPGTAARQPETVGAPGTGVPAEGEEPAPGTAVPGQANSEEQALMAEEQSGGARSTAVPPVTGGRGNTGTGDPEHRRRYGLPTNGEKRFGTTERTIPPVIGETVAQRAHREAQSDARPN